MGFHLTLLIGAIPAILFVGLVAATLFAALCSRPGIQQGFRVYPGLRFVDAGSVGCHTFTQLFGMLLWIMLPWREFFHQQVAPFWLLVCGFAMGMILALGLTATITTFTLRCLFRFTGILSAEQAKYYPLKANKTHVDPWPRCWQEPCPRRLGGHAQPDGAAIRAEPGAAPDHGGR